MPAIISSDTIYTNKVRKYYDQSQKWYNLFWSDKESLGMHFGFWEPGTDSHKEALINQYRSVQKYIHIQPGEKILDVGCGIGGASIWFARTLPGEFIGITLSPVQLQQAIRNAQKAGVTDRVSFKLINYFKTGFPDCFFDKIFSIESACYSYPNPEVLYKELFRILKPGGTLVISDGVMSRKPNNPYEQRLFREWFDSWALPGGSTIKEVEQALTNSSFENIQYINKTKEIKPHVIKLYRLCRIFYPLLWFLGKFSNFFRYGYNNTIGGINQKLLYDTGAFAYGIFVATKPYY